MAKVFDVLGKLAKLGGMAANLAGQPEIGIPLSVAGGVAEGASGGGVKGGLIGGAKSGISSVMPPIAGSLGQVGLDSIFKPMDTGATTAFSSSGSPVTVPGARANPIEGLFGASGKPMDIPASPTSLGGS